MDAAGDRAKSALRDIPDDVVKAVADWWSQWYASAGHRRLGRLLLSHKGASSKSAKVISADKAQSLSPVLEHPLPVKFSGELRYVLSEASLDSPSFFELTEVGGELRLLLNSTHPAFRVLKPALCAGLQRSLRDARAVEASEDPLLLMLLAWADVERQQPYGFRRQRAQQAREDWGRALRDLMVSNDHEVP